MTGATILGTGGEAATSLAEADLLRLFLLGADMTPFTLAADFLCCTTNMEHLYGRKVQTEF